MATKKPAKPTPKPTSKSTPKPTPKPKATPPVKAPVPQKKSIPKPLMIVGGSMSLGSCALACLCLLMRRGGGRTGGRVPNVFGASVPAPAKPSGLPATMLSGILLSVCVGVVASIIFMVLTRQRRMTDAVRAELHGKLFDALRRLTAANEANRARFARYSRALERVQARNKRAAAENAWISNPFTLPIYEKVPRFVLLGKVLGGEYATLEEAKGACNNTQNATHIQVDTKTGRAVVKTIMELPESFGTETSTAATLTKRCGEGFHKYMDTYMHPRFFLLNEANRIVKRDWADITMADLLQTQETQEKKKGQLNAACLLGKSNTCIWESVGKQGLFGILSLTFAYLGVVTGVFTAGLTLFPSLLIEVALVGVDIGITTGVPTALSKEQAKEAEALSNRMKMLKTGEILMCNSYLGEKESWWGLYSRLTLPECSTDKGELEYAFWAQDDYEHIKGQVPDGTYNPTAEGWGKLAPHQYSMYEKLGKYENLPVDFWNCDEITGLLQAQSRFSLTNKDGRVKRHEKGPNACAEADAKFTF